tara:strand:- start:259 stop:597 length:339 start_codon:yes stop_codon:yes gene_type:complete
MRTRSRNYSFPRNGTKSNYNGRDSHSAYPSSPQSVLELHEQDKEVVCTPRVVFCGSFVFTTFFIFAFLTSLSAKESSPGAWFDLSEPAAPMTPSITEMLVERGKYWISTLLF